MNKDITYMTYPNEKVDKPEEQKEDTFEQHDLSVANKNTGGEK